MMIDTASVITRGGLVVWSHSFGDDMNSTAEVSTSINSLIQSVIIEERGGERHSCVNGIHYRWNIINSLDVIFFITYRGIQNAKLLTELLNLFSDKFIKKTHVMYPDIKKINWVESIKPLDFDDDFCSIILDNTKVTPSESQPVSRTVKTKVKDGRTKVMRQWDVKTTVSKKDLDELDYSIDTDAPSVEAPPKEETYNIRNIFSSLSDGLKSLKTVFKSETDVKHGLLDQFSTMVLNYAGNLMITEEVIKEPIEQLKSKLRSKNVASDICDMIADSVVVSLVGKRTESLKSLSATVHEALGDSIRRILTPKEPINLMQKIRESNSMDEVYSIVFLGVNGVGKSTNLAKVTYLLKSNGFKPLLIACDTFRSGAVEQLRIHSKRLDVELFERGYGKDPSQIAKEGLKYAQSNNFNVVLIDTAGRMQDNEPLMAALGKLISVNNPNLILFVGEALVGNDAVDQLKKFNLSITKVTEGTNNRNIDGMILTKFDTVDDKVGTALSMTYITGKPILFVGNGQNYTDLAKLDVNLIIKSLIK